MPRIFKNVKPGLCPRLKVVNKRDRIQFAENPMKQEMNSSKIIFSPEKKFNLYVPYGIHL